jgi:hypothetical protein
MSESDANKNNTSTQESDAEKAERLAAAKKKVRLEFLVLSVREQ